METSNFVSLQVISTDMESSSLSLTEKGNVISEEDVLQQLQYSRTFSWCIYRKRNILRHVGIMIMFDGEPFCTVDFGVENLSPKLIVASASTVRIKRVPPGFENCVDCENVMENLDTRNQSSRKRAKETIHNLVTPNQKLYSLLFYNCRDNTRDVMNRVCSSGQCYGESLEDSVQMVQRTEEEDRALSLLVVLVSFAGICLLLSLIGRLRQQHK